MVPAVIKKQMAPAAIKEHADQPARKGADGENLALNPIPPKML